MNCQRCQANESRYRVYTDIMNVKVCTSCAIKALELGIAVEALPRLRTDQQQILNVFEQLLPQPKFKNNKLVTMACDDSG